MGGSRRIVTWNPDYGVARPSYPPALFEYLRLACQGHTLAWDCATGTGQAAVPLAGIFRRVVATDVDAGQLSRAEAHPEVSYIRAEAERAPLPTGSVDLVTVAQALHWFDRPAFFTEAGRVLRDGGVLAAWSYFLPSVTPAIDEIVRRLYSEILGPDWPPEVREVEDGYAQITFPFPSDPPLKEDFEMLDEWDLDRFVRYLGTWAAVERHRRRTGLHPIEEHRGELEAAWGLRGTTRMVRWHVVLRASLKS